MFDPFAATEAQARAEPNVDGIPDGVFYKWQAAQRITEGQSQYEANPIQGIAVCLRARIMPPQWLVHSFLKQFDLVRDAEVRTWDEAFGQPYPKSVRLETLRPKSAQVGLLDHMIKVGFLDQLFKGPKRTLTGEALPRTEKGFEEAHEKLPHVPVKTIKQKLTKTRKNVRGGKDRYPSKPELNLHDPFNLAKKRS